MIQKKVALLGAPAVGKTSLVRQYVESRFDEKYLSTIGVKVDKKSLRVNEQDMTLMIWDVAGPDEYFPVRSEYVRGASGYLLVLDGTRPETLSAGLKIVDQMNREVGKLDYVMVLNKLDLVAQWKIPDEALRQCSCSIVRASAKTGEGVERAFTALTELMIG
jgi:small GTP-binding protein